MEADEVRWGSECSADPHSSAVTSAAGSSDARTSAPLIRSLGASAWWRGSDTPSVRAFAPAWCKVEEVLRFPSATMLPPATVFAECCVPKAGRTQSTSPCPGLEGRGGLRRPWRSRGWIETGCCSGVSWRSWRALSFALQSGIHKAVGRALGSQWVLPCQESWCRRRRRRSALSCCPQS